MAEIYTRQDIAQALADAVRDMAEALSYFEKEFDDPLFDKDYYPTAAGPLKKHAETIKLAGTK